jgi:4-hydroxy-tetrahydrodipicolinate synthase
MATKTKLRGVIPAIITPMDQNGEIDFAALEKQTIYLSDAGVNGLFVCGGTGEGAYLSTKEKEAVFSMVRKITGNKLFLCLALIESCTKDVLEEMTALKQCQPDYIVAVTPFYHAMNQKDIFDHYRQIAAAAFAPVLIYNIPPRTHNPIVLETINALSNEQNIVGIKDSSGDFISFSRGLFGPRSDSFAWIQGEDYLCGPSLLAGGDGVVSGLSNARVEPYVAMYQAYEREDWREVRACQARINKLYEIIHCCDDGNAAIKAATELSGRGSRWMRQKSQTVSETQRDKISAILAEYDATR